MAIVACGVSASSPWLEATDRPVALSRDGPGTDWSDLEIQANLRKPVPRTRTRLVWVVPVVTPGSLQNRRADGAAHAQASQIALSEHRIWCLAPSG